MVKLFMSTTHLLLVAFYYAGDVIYINYLLIDACMCERENR